MIDRLIKDFCCAENENLVDTVAGTLRGYRQNEVYEFKGIRYAEAERFRMPKPVTPWEGVKEALDYGFLCPTRPETTMAGNLAFPKRYWFWDENCQYLNVWTKWLNDETAKKPVIVWLHGGGFSSGSSIELECYDGENMCRYGDVVQVSVNHRLNVYGFLDLSDFGPEYEMSGIVGMEDIVVALKWVRDNIAKFGGDPDQVTIMGESGGGGKVRTLMNMGSADGLYCRAICDSGVLPEEDDSTPEEQKEAAKAMGRKFVELAGGLDKLLVMNNNELLGLMKEVGRVNWQPTPLTGSYIGEWLNAGFRKETLDIPMIVGSNFTELTPRPKDAVDKNTLTDAERFAALVAAYGEEGAPLIAEEFKKSYPEFNLYYASILDGVFRRVVTRFVNARVAAGGKNTFNFLFAHESYYHGGIISTHADELFFAFHNAEYFGSQYGGEFTWELQEMFFRSFITFAYTGDPNNELISEWRKVTPEDHACFVFSKVPGTRTAFDEKLMEYIGKYSKYSVPGFHKKKK